MQRLSQPAWTLSTESVQCGIFQPFSRQFCFPSVSCYDSNPSLVPAGQSSQSSPLFFTLLHVAQLLASLSGDTCRYSIVMRMCIWRMVCQQAADTCMHLCRPESICLPRNAWGSLHTECAGNTAVTVSVQSLLLPLQLQLLSRYLALPATMQLLELLMRLCRPLPVFPGQMRQYKTLRNMG